LFRESNCRRRIFLCRSNVRRGAVRAFFPSSTSLRRPFRGPDIRRRRPPPLSHSQGTKPHPARGLKWAFLPAHVGEGFLPSVNNGIPNKRLKDPNKEARAPGLPVLAYFGLTSRFSEANKRHYAFMIEGLEETTRALAQKGIRLVVLREKAPLRAAKAPARNRVAAEAPSWGSEAGTVALAGGVDRGYLRIQRERCERACEIRQG